MRQLSQLLSPLQTVKLGIRLLLGLVMILGFGQSVWAAASNPGATCPANYAQGRFTNSDYTNLVNNQNSGSFFNVNGNAAGAIPLQMRVAVTESSTATTKSNFSAINDTFNIARVFPTVNDYTDISLTFRNSSTQQPIYLTNVALSAFDIDISNNTSNQFDDYVKITGITQTGSTIQGSIQSIAGSSVGYNNGLLNNDSFNCAAKDLNTSCQGSIQFSEPVSNVTIRYTNATRFVTKPTNQEIDVRVDNYCYLPDSYDITKTDGLTSVGSGNNTSYVIKVTNTGGSILSNVALKDPAATGISKLSGITCDTSDSTNTCSTPPTVSQLESASGFTIASLGVGRSYSIVVPARITAAAGGSVTNTATISHSTLATKSAADTNTVTAPFDSGTSATPASCPAGHRMYYVGANPPSGAYLSTGLTGWGNGSTSRTYSFNDATGPKTFTISFTSILDLYTQYQTPSPFYGDIPNATAGALNIIHNSPAARSNHTLNIAANRSVSKMGYVVQDLDSFVNSSSQYPYQERVDVSGSGGILNFQSQYHTINAANNIVTSILGRNCETTNSCPINATWGYKPLGSTVSLVHSNATSQYDAPHAVGYTDFYFCLAPPKVIVNKNLTGTRVNDTSSNRDQFAISVNNGSTVVSSFETTGTGQTITNGSSGAVNLAENISYTISERVVNSANNGDILNYDATYACTNSATGSTTVMPTSAMTYNAATKTRSFTLSNVTFGDEITCTITNAPAKYSFTGFVFNDNGGITASSATQYDVSSTFTGNANYANGVFDSNESGISVSGLQVSLTDCSGNLLASTNTNPQVPSSTAGTVGQYRFEVLPSTLAGKTKVCLIETEPSSWDFTIDTTADSREIALVAGTYEYKTLKDGSGNVTRNMDFGELRAQNAALVLRKSQYVHTCNAALNYTSIADTNDPMTGFSTNPANNVQPGNCIAYKIDAFNRGHIDILDVQIRDSLQKAPVTSVFQLPKPLGNPTTVYSSTNNSAVIGTNGTIVSDKFTLNKVPTSSTTPTKATLYFNSKYGATPTAP